MLDPESPAFRIRVALIRCEEDEVLPIESTQSRRSAGRLKEISAWKWIAQRGNRLKEIARRNKRRRLAEALLRQNRSARIGAYRIQVCHCQRLNENAKSPPYYSLAF